MTRGDACETAPPRECVRLAWCHLQFKTNNFKERYSMHPRLTRAVAVVAASAMTLLPTYPAYAQQSGGSPTETPIKHVLVIFQENVSVDHSFGDFSHPFNLPRESPLPPTE